MTDKIYLENPYIREMYARITKKEYSSGKFYITLNRTIFYPHMSGGQPRDLGTINGIEVKDVYEDGDEIIHVVEDNISEEKVHLSIDWNNRFDHMQQHTGQHILSAAFSELFNADTVGFHLGSEFVYIDVTIPALKDDDVRKVELYANEIVFSNFPIKKYIIDKENLSSIPLRKEPTVESNIRIVEIDGIDYSPCGGTHHISTGEVGLIKIRKWEKYKGNTRVQFICGSRALKDFSWKNIQINNISNLLSAKDCDSYSSVLRLYDENKNLSKEIKALKEDVLKYKSNNLLTQSYDYNGINIIELVLEDMDFKEVKYMASNILNNDNTIVALGLKGEDKGSILIGRSKNIDIDILDVFNSVIGLINGRGGGSPQIAQGGGQEINKVQEAISKAISIIKENLNGSLTIS